MNGNNKSKSKHFHHVIVHVNNDIPPLIKHSPNANANANGTTNSNLLSNKENMLTSSIGGSDTSLNTCGVPNLGANTINNTNHNIAKNIKAKHSSERDIIKCTSHHHNNITPTNNLLNSKNNHNQNIISHVHLQNVPSSSSNPVKNYVPIKPQGYACRYVAKSQSKRNIIAKGLRDCESINKQTRDKDKEKDKDKQNKNILQIKDKDIKEKSLKLPKIIKQEIQIHKPRQCRSVKKIHTEPPEMQSTDSQNQLSIPMNSNSNTNILKNMSPKQNMKQVLLNIVKEKQNRHLVSIDDQIEKLELLTKRYSCLRKDLVSIQQDILTIGFKQKIKDKGKQSQSSSVVFL